MAPPKPIHRTTTNILSITLLILLSTFFHVQAAGGEAVLNVVHFGASPGGERESTEAFLRAWSAACESREPATVYVPAGEFLVGAVVFRGHCNSTAVGFRVDGTVVAPEDYADLGDVNDWIKFEHVEGLSIRGGTIDGRGAGLWACKADGKDCPKGPKSLAINHCKDVNITSLTSVNSKFFHIMVSGSSGVRLHNLTIAAPGDSPNTDGVHVQGSDGVRISNATITTGDDCISMGPGTTNLWAHNIFCGPGHGISVGSLGSEEDEAGVQNIKVNNVVFNGTQNGVRIKTWAKPSHGYVDGVSFQEVTMQNVKNPILIDQNYCPSKVDCPQQGSGIRISNVTYSDIQGTSATRVAVNFDCSPRQPCSVIQMHDVKLTYENQQAQSSCNYATGTTSGYIIPPSCLTT